MRISFGRGTVAVMMLAGVLAVAPAAPAAAAGATIVRYDATFLAQPVGPPAEVIETDRFRILRDLPVRATLTRDGRPIGSTESLQTIATNLQTGHSVIYGRPTVRLPEGTFVGTFVAHRDETGATGGLIARAVDGSGRVMTMRFEAGPGFIGDPTTWQITVLDPSGGG